MRQFFKNFSNGVAFGITETIPGVSAGTIAIILGFYFELIEAINHFTENLRKSLAFLVPLVLGIITGIVLFSSILHYLLTHYSFPVMLFFIGLIVGIIPHISVKAIPQLTARETASHVADKCNGKLTITDIVLIALPFILLVALSFIKPAAVSNAAVSVPEEVILTIGIPYMAFIFFAGILAAAALVIPGISGSFVLLLLGIYPLAIYSVSSIRVWLGDMGNMALFLNICKVLGPLAVGVIIGGLSMVRLIEKLLKNHQKTVYSIILGLLSGSVCVLFRDPMVYKSGISALVIIIGIVTFFAGAVLSFMLGKKRL